MVPKATKLLVMASIGRTSVGTTIAFAPIATIAVPISLLGGGGLGNDGFLHLNFLLRRLSYLVSSVRLLLELAALVSVVALGHFLAVPVTVVALADLISVRVAVVAFLHLVTPFVRVVPIVGG